MKRFLAILLMCLMGLSGTNACAEWLYATGGDTYVHYEYEENDEYYDDYEQYDNYDEEYENYDEFVYNEDDYYDEYYSQEEFEFEVVHSTKARALPDVNARSLGKIAKRTRIYSSKIYTSYDGRAWLEIQGDNGDIGYVLSNHVSLTEGLINNHFPKLSRFMCVTGGSVNVREHANINSKSLFTIHKGDAIIVDYYICVYDSERRMWAHAYDEQGNYLGFVSTLYLTPNVG